MSDPVTVLSVKGFAPSSADAVAAWCVANPPGYLYLADFPGGNEPWAHTQASVDAMALAYAIRAACYRAGTDCLVGLGVRPDVLSPRTGRNRPASGLTPAWSVASSVSVVDAAEAWPEEWTGALKGNLDAAWWSDVVQANPNAIAYAFADPAAKRFEVVGALAPLHDAAYRAWAVQHALAALAAYRADFAVVGVKFWETVPYDHLHAGNLDESNLLQPPTWTRGVWAHAVSELLAGIAAEWPVVTMRVPRDVGLQATWISPQAQAAVLGEYAPGVLS